MRESGIHFELTREQEALQRVAHDFAAAELRPVAAEADEREAFPDGLLQRAARVGLTSFAIPERYGGAGVGAVTSALVVEELAWGCAGLGATIQATMFPVRPLIRFGSEAQRTRYLTLLARPEGALGAIAFTEAHAGSDLKAMRTEARYEGAAFVLNGEKAYVTNGGVADVTVVFARLDGEITAFLLERGDDGVSAGRTERKLGLRASPTGSLLLEEARLPADRLLGEPGQGFAVALDFFAASRPQVAASAVGVARACLEEATAYACRREAFGRPVIDRQGVSFKLADIATEVEAARLLVWRACAALDNDRDAGLLGSYAKVFATDAAMRAATDAVQIMGGAGVMRDQPVEKWFRDAKVLQIVEGTSEIQRQIIARYLKDGGRGADSGPR